MYTYKLTISPQEPIQASVEVKNSIPHNVSNINSTLIHRSHILIFPKFSQVQSHVILGEKFILICIGRNGRDIQVLTTKYFSVFLLFGDKV